MAVAGIILGAILGLFLLLLLLPARVRVRYDKTWALWAGLGPVMVRLWPARPPKPAGERRRGQPKKKPKKARAAAPAPEHALKIPLTFDALIAYVRLGQAALGRMTRALRIRRLALCWRIACRDPGLAAMTYGGAAAALAGLIPLVEGNLNWRHTDILIEADFEGRGGLVFEAEMGIVLIIALAAGLRLAWGFLKHRRQNPAGQAVKTKG